MNARAYPVQGDMVHIADRASERYCVAHGWDDYRGILGRLYWWATHRRCGRRLL